MKRGAIEKVLIEMGMPVKLKGFKYITDAVMLLDEPDWQSPKWTALYYKIGIMNHDSPSRVERAIRNAFATTRNRVADYEKIEHYIGFTNCENSNSITYLYRSIKQEIEREEEIKVRKEKAAYKKTFAISEDTLKDMIRQIMVDLLLNNHSEPA